MVSVSSVAGARYREAMFNSWDKNDPKDATVILHLLKQGIVQYYHDPLLAGDHDLQELAKTYRRIALGPKRLADSLLNHYLPLYFPEMARYWESTRVEWFVTFLERFPTPEAVRVLSKEAFVQAAWALVGRKVNKRAKLEGLYELAHRSIALPVPLDAPALETFRLQLGQLRRLATLRDEARSACPCPPEGTCRLPTPLLLAGSGLHPRLGHSGRGRGPSTLPASSSVPEVLRLGPREAPIRRSRGRETLSKRGNARLRMAFWMAAQRAVRMTENSFRDKYERYTKQDPGNPDVRRKALTAVAAEDGAGGLCTSQAEPTVSRLSRTCPAQRIDPSHAGRWGDRDPVDNARTFRWDPTLY